MAFSKRHGDLATSIRTVTPKMAIMATQTGKSTNKHVENIESTAFKISQSAVTEQNLCSDYMDKELMTSTSTKKFSTMVRNQSP